MQRQKLKEEPMILQDRIAKALDGTASSRDIPPLIAEVEPLLAELGKQYTAARERALDPAVSSHISANEKALSDDLKFQGERMEIALRSLNAELQTAKDREADAIKRDAYETVMAERDKLAEELRRVYPELEAKLADLVGRMTKNSWLVKRVNNALPSGVRAPLLDADEMVRGVQCQTPLKNILRLPRFKALPHEHQLAWPPKDPGPEMFAASLTPRPKLVSSKQVA